MKFTMVALLVLANVSYGATYYVANGGNDLNDGRNPNSPWKTIAKVEAANLQPGDTILLKRGDEWREMLDVHWSGSPAARIEFSSYGSGALPIISGADIRAGWLSEEENSFKIYSTVQAADPTQAFEDGTRLAVASAKNAMFPGSYWFDYVDSKLYIRLREDANPNDHLVEVSARNYAIAFFCRSHLSFSGLQIQMAERDNFAAAGAFTDVIVDNVQTFRAHEAGMSFYSPDEFSPQDNLYVHRVLSAFNAGTGILKINGGNNVVVDSCVAHDNAFDSSVSDYQAGIRFVSDGSSDARRIRNSEIRYSTAYNNGYLNGVAALAQRGHGIWCDTCGTGTRVHHNIAYHNNKAGIMIEWAGAAGGVTADHNLAYDNETGILLSRMCHYVLIVNNTAYHNYVNLSAQGQYGGGETVVGMVGNIIANNITSDATGHEVVAQWGMENNSLGEGYGNIWSNNCFGPPHAAFAIFGLKHILSTYAQIDAAYGGPLHSVQEDPQLVSPTAGNFSLLPPSPARGAGLVFPAIMSHACSKTPNIGAY
jgi:hypothetical protein